MIKEKTDEPSRKMEQRRRKKMERDSRKEAQAAVEFLMIASISLLLIVPALVLFFDFTRETTYKTLNERVGTIGKTMVETAQSTYYYGNEASEVVDFDFPPKIISLTIVNEHELVLTLEAEEGNSEIVFYSQPPLSGSFTEEDITEGIKRFKFYNNNGIIEITELDE